MPRNNYSYHRLGGQTDEDFQKLGSKWQILWRSVNSVMVIFFLLSTYVQINDPDPYIWVPAYLVPAALCFSIVLKPDVTSNPIWKWICVIHMGLCVIGALILIALLVELLTKRFVNPFEHEEGRELGGTLIMLLWLSACRFTQLGSADPKKGAGNAILLVTGFLAVSPLIFWSLCFIKGLDNLGHCKNMFPGLLGSGPGE